MGMVWVSAKNVPQCDAVCLQCACSAKQSPTDGRAIDFVVDL